MTDLFIKIRVLAVMAMVFLAVAGQVSANTKIKISSDDNGIVREQTLTAVGDIDRSGVVNVKDMMLIINHILDIRVLSEAEFSEADLSGDGFVDMIDVMQLLNMMNEMKVPTMPGSEVPRLVIEKVMPQGNKFVADDAMALFIGSSAQIKIINSLGQAKVRYNGNLSAVSIEYDDYGQRMVELAKTDGTEVYRIGWESVASDVRDDYSSSTGQCSPNPSSGAITIVNPLGKATLYIYNASGCQVWSQEISEERFTYQGSLSSGHYSYVISNDNTIVKGKFIIVK